MEKIKRDFKKATKRKVVFAWTPKYQEEFYTNLKPRLFIEIAMQTFEKLSCDVVYWDDHTIEAKRNNGYSNWTEKITITYQNKKLKVFSKSLRANVTDLGRNSKRVREFIFVYKYLESKQTPESLEALEEKLYREDNDLDYEIPTSLPKPKVQKPPRYWVLNICLLGFALLIGLIMTVIPDNEDGSDPFIPLFVLTMLSFVFLFKYLLRLSNYTNVFKIRLSFIGFIFAELFFGEVFLFLEYNAYQQIDFFNFLIERYSGTLLIQTFNSHWGNLIFNIIICLIFYFFTAHFTIPLAVTGYQTDRIPKEVIEFMLYHFNQDKTEEEVRAELYKLGWTEKRFQDEALAAVVGVFVIQDYHRWA